jgi:hypothetical protein
MQYTLPATYGSQLTPCDIHVVKVHGGFWYACHGSRNVNFTVYRLTDYTRRINVEVVPDSDFLTASAPVTSPADIARMLR